MPFTEKQLRDHLWDQRENWPELIDPAPPLVQYVFAEDLSDVTPGRLLLNLTRRRLAELDEAVRAMRLIGKEVKLHQEGESTIRADLMGRFPDDSGLAVVELKIGDQTERQSFTELLGYANHFVGMFPTMCRSDMVYVLVAPIQNRIVKEAILQALLFDRKPVCPLTWTAANPEDVTTVRLQPWIPTEQDLRPLAQQAFSPKNFSIEQGVWADEEGRWTDRELNSLCSLVSQEMEAEGIHGFVYCSKEFEEVGSLLPNTVTIAGLNPFEVAHDNYCITELETPLNQLQTTLHSDVQLQDLVPGLEEDGQEADDNFLRSLSVGWLSHLIRVRQKVVRRSLKRNDGEAIQQDRGAMNWHQLMQSFADRQCDYCEVRPTGIIRDVLWEYATVYYNWHVNQPEEFQGDLFRYLGEAVTDFGWFRKFIHQMWLHE